MASVAAEKGARGSRSAVISALTAERSLGPEVTILPISRLLDFFRGFARGRLLIYYLGLCALKFISDGIG
jgi:hypothetical protein